MIVVCLYKDYVEIADDLAEVYCEAVSVRKPE